MPDGGARPDCAPGDSPQARLTSRRQPAGQTDVPATGRRQKRVLAVARRRVCRPAVAAGRICQPSPSRLASRRQPAAQTVHPATTSMPDCASGDTPRDRLCIRRQPEVVSGRSLSPDAQFGTRAVAGCTVQGRGRARSAWLSGDPARGAWRGCLRPSYRHSATRDPSTPLAFGSLRSG